MGKINKKPGETVLNTATPVKALCRASEKELTKNWHSKYYI
jgi:hypothetical protein